MGDGRRFTRRPCPQHCHHADFRAGAAARFPRPIRTCASATILSGDTGGTTRAEPSLPARASSRDPFAECADAGHRFREEAIAKAAAEYRRWRHLPKLLGIPKKELADPSIASHRKRIARLLRLAQISSLAGKVGHWSYNPKRHVAILGALEAERMQLAARLKEGREKAASPNEEKTVVST